MVSFQQLLSCQPQKFNEAGQTYRRMAEGFGKVESVFRQANQVISGTADWSSIAQQAAIKRAGTLTRGLQASGQETNTAGTVLTTLGTALIGAQTALRAAVAEAMTGPLIMTPDGQTIIPPWAYSWPACVEELPRLQALKAAVDVQIRAALTTATAADMTAAGAIAKLAVGQLIKDFGSSHAPTSSNQTDPDATMNTQATILPASHRPGAATGQPGAATGQPDAATGQPDAATGQPDAATGQPGAATGQPDTSSDVQGMLNATRGASTDGTRVDQGVTAADWRGMSADGAAATGTRVAQADADGGQQVSGTIGAAAVAGSAATTAVARRAAPPAVQAATAREVTVRGRRYVVYGDEVRSGGSISWRARNPGNIRQGENYGAVPGVWAHAAGNGTFAVFPDEQTGMTAITQVLRHYGHVTVADAMSRYAPAADRNDPVAYAAGVARAMGVGTDAYVDTLTQEQLDTFALEIRRVEGWRAGTSYPPDDPNLPAAVRRAAQQMRPPRR